MKKQKVYLDTSIISFLYADDEPEKRDITIEFFESYLTDYDVAISPVVIVELTRTTNVARRRKLLGAVRRYSLLVLKLSSEKEDKVLALAQEYILAAVIPPGKHEDAVHLAIATVLEYDILLSWNFRHLANVRKEGQVHDVNARNGYHHPLRLLSPMQVIYEE